MPLSFWKDISRGGMICYSMIKVAAFKLAFYQNVFHNSLHSTSIIYCNYLKYLNSCVTFIG